MQTSLSIGYFFSLPAFLYDKEKNEVVSLRDSLATKAREVIHLQETAK